MIWETIPFPKVSQRLEKKYRLDLLERRKYCFQPTPKSEEEDEEPTPYPLRAILKAPASKPWPAVTRSLHGTLMSKRWQATLSLMFTIQKPLSANKRQRRKGKHDKKHLYKKGYALVMKVEGTPGSQLARTIQNWFDKELPADIRVKVQELAGKHIKNIATNTNKFKDKPNCGRVYCHICKSSTNGGSGGKCWRQNVTYQISCRECGKGNNKAVYIRESKGAYQRTLKHA